MQGCGDGWPVLPKPLILAAGARCGVTGGVTSGVRRQGRVGEAWPGRLGRLRADWRDALHSTAHFESHWSLQRSARRTSRPAAAHLPHRGLCLGTAVPSARAGAPWNACNAVCGDRRAPQCGWPAAGRQRRQRAAHIIGAEERRAAIQDAAKSVSQATCRLPLRCCGYLGWIRLSCLLQTSRGGAGAGAGARTGIGTEPHPASAVAALRCSIAIPTIGCTVRASDW